MDVSNLYVPNVTKWIKYYQDTINKHTLNGKHRNQRGGSLVSGAKTFITPIEYNKKNTPSQMEVSDVPVKIISPAQAVVEQASTEIDHKTHVKKGIKRKHKSKSIRKEIKHRRLRIKNSNKKKSRKRLLKKKKSRKHNSDTFKKKSRSHEGQPSELSLFDLPPTQVGVENIRMENVRPTSTITDSSPILFDISGQNGLEYLDLFNSQIHVKLRVLHDDNSVLAADENIDVSIQGKALSTTSGYYPYKAYIQTLLRYGSDAKQSQLSTQLWLKDTNGHFDDVDFTNGDNTNGMVRMAYIRGSKLLDLQGPIMHDLFQVRRYILNQVGVGIRFHRSNANFSLLSNEAKKYKIDIQEMTLKVCKIQVNPAVITAHNALLNSTNAKYPYTKNRNRLHDVSKRNLELFVESCVSGQLPKQAHNRFCQQSECEWYTGEWGPLQLSYNNTTGYTVVEVLSNLLMTARKWLNDEGIEISRDDIPGGCALYAFDTTPDFDGNEYLSLKNKEA
ncbi:unnamed protein product [Mytilus coruscus]|uniref:Uncharacterized protein n=1 Tax=Mytilus coruscus TaxID=42192 RepID=A0A6J8ABA4_MYTCO|nr:unnamed protein product [Mytilus coruscus]